jgi:hypothetical protein
VSYPLQGNQVQGNVKLTDEQIKLLEELASDSDYWSNALDFIHQTLGRELSSLSDKQVDWYYQIIASLDVEFNRREAIKAFENGAEYHP